MASPRDNEWSHLRNFNSLATQLFFQQLVQIITGLNFFFSITVMAHEHHGISNHLKFNFSFNNLFRLTTKKASNFHITGFVGGDPQMTGWFPSQRAIIPYLRVYHVENYVIHHHVILHGKSRSKIYWHHLFIRYKRKTPDRRVVQLGRSLAGITRRNPPPDASKWSPSSQHPTRGVFL